MLYILLLGIAGAPDWVPTEFRDGNRYSLEHVSSPQPTRVEYKRLSDEVQISLICGYLEAGQTIRETEKHIQSFVHPRRETRDGYPLAEILSDWTDKWAYVVVSGGTERVTVRLSGPDRRSGNRRTTEAKPLDRDMAWAEDVARKTFAAWSARRIAGSSTSNSMSGYDVKTFRTTSDTQLIDLTDYSQKRGFSLTFNEEKTRCAFTLAGENFVVPLGSRSVKKGSNWVTLSDYVMTKSGHVLIPKSVFD